jgi:hypothetical protein
VAASDQQTPPTSAVTTTAPPATHEVHAGGRATVGPMMPHSRPTHISIPAIGVDHGLRPTGLNPDGTMHTPPLSEVAWPVWYEYSPTPGQQGPAVIVGHIDSAKKGPGVFYRLGALTRGDEITVARADQTTAQFTVYRLGEYPKTDFPTGTVYGNTHRAELRLISCGGTFNHARHSYRDDIVAYARLTTT